MLASPSEFEGVLLVDKCQGMTSHDVVNRIRRILQMRRIGHAGTLDPLATGLLVILVGKATKASQFLMSLNKVYTGKFKLGETTNSHDSEGEVTDTQPIPADLTEDSLTACCKQFLGGQYQVPPMFSAKKFQGKPLYKLARQGKTVERKPRFIHISEFKLLVFDVPEVSFQLSCSKGTYVRTLVHDLGQKIGCGAHMTALRRLSIDRFHVKDAVTLEALQNMTKNDITRALIPIYQAVPSHVY